MASKTVGCHTAPDKKLADRASEALRSSGRAFNYCLLWLICVFVYSLTIFMC